MLQHLSSMRAATSVGLIFIGAHQSSEHVDRADGSSFKPRVILSNAEVAGLRASIAEAIARSAAFWQGELEQWADEFGEEAVEKLREQING